MMLFSQDFPGVSFLLLKSCADSNIYSSLYIKLYLAVKFLDNFFCKFSGKKVHIFQIKSFKITFILL